MKYSITFDHNITEAPLKLSSKYSKIFSTYSSLTSLQIMQQDHVRLKYMPNLQLQQNKGSQNSEIQITPKQGILWQRVKFVCKNEQQWILVFEDPFQIYFVINRYKKMVPIKLQETIQLTQLVCSVIYPDLLVYGHNPINFTNSILSINLLTFQSKEMSSSKGYSPGDRVNYWAYFSEGRLYISGGLNKQGKQVEELFWTFNLQNGNWFALDMPLNGLSLPTSRINCQIESGKILTLDKQNIYIIELYQSRVRILEEWKGSLTQKQLQSIKGIYIYNSWIYLYDNQGMMPVKLKITKMKVQK